jgi:hypothetical protein
MQFYLKGLALGIAEKKKPVVRSPLRWIKPGIGKRPENKI